MFFGYTGEYTGDSTDLVYLRARYYSPNTGSFTTHDTWTGNAYLPMSFNAWNYVNGNPINRADPSGLCWYPDLQTGETQFDLLTPTSNLCPWFIDILKQKGWNIPPSASPDNWINYIPEGDRSQFLASHSNLITIVSTNGENNPVWQIIYYGKKATVEGYREIQPIHEDKGGQFLFYGIPMVAEAGMSIGYRTDNTGEHEVTSVFSHIGPGIDIFGVAQIHVGVQTGSSTGIYLEGELFDRDCGIKLAFPDTGVYFPGAEFGITTTTYQSHWILTTKKFISDSGGYSWFGKRYVFPEGFDSYYILKEGYDRDSLKLWWSVNMSERYTLEEKP